jgi:hypothetical protein
MLISLEKTIRLVVVVEVVAKEAVVAEVAQALRVSGPVAEVLEVPADMAAVVLKVANLKAVLLVAVSPRTREARTTVHFSVADARNGDTSESIAQLRRTRCGPGLLTPREGRPGSHELLRSSAAQPRCWCQMHSSRRLRLILWSRRLGRRSPPSSRGCIAL